MHASGMNENLKKVTVFEEEKGRMKMIITGCFKNYGQLEDQAAGVADVEAFVFRNGEVVPADQAQNSDTTVIHTAPEKNYAR